MATAVGTMSTESQITYTQMTIYHSIKPNLFSKIIHAH